MTRLVLVLVAAALGTGCYGSSEGPRGSFDVRWSFVRTTYDTTTLRYGCDLAGIDTVGVTFGRGSTVQLPCRGGAGEGAVVQRAPAGAQVVTLTGYRGGAALYESSFDVVIPEGGVAAHDLDLFGIPDELDIYAWFLRNDGVDIGYNDVADPCAHVEVTTLSWSLVDWAGTVVDAAEASCTFPPGVSYRVLPARDSRLDRDQYVIRMQGLGPARTIEFDSATTAATLGGITCSGQPFDHYGPSVGNFAWDVLLFDVVGNLTVCP